MSPQDLNTRYLLSNSLSPFPLKGKTLVNLVINLGMNNKLILPKKIFCCIPIIPILPLRGLWEDLNLRQLKNQALGKLNLRSFILSSLLLRGILGRSKISEDLSSPPSSLEEFWEDLGSEPIEKTNLEKIWIFQQLRLEPAQVLISTNSSRQLESNIRHILCMGEVKSKLVPRIYYSIIQLVTQ